jgi:hypothetical protein
MHVPEAQLDLFGIDNILSCLKTLLAGVVTVHHGHMPLIQILSPTTASGIWAMEDLRRTAEYRADNHPSSRASRGLGRN